jgi:hypothetical protein
MPAALAQHLCRPDAEHPVIVDQQDAARARGWLVCSHVSPGSRPAASVIPDVSDRLSSHDTIASL